MLFAESLDNQLQRQSRMQGHFKGLWDCYFSYFSLRYTENSITVGIEARDQD